MGRDKRFTCRDLKPSYTQIPLNNGIPESRSLSSISEEKKQHRIIKRKKREEICFIYFTYTYTHISAKPIVVMNKLFRAI